MAGTTETNSGAVKITPDSLAKSYVKYRKELITIPQRSLSIMLPYVTLRPGIRYKEVVGQMDGDIELAPYNPIDTQDADTTINARELETFLGDVVKPFDPNSVVQSIYGSDTVQGEGLKNVPITALVFAFLLKKLGDKLLNAVFTAVRNPKGKTTKDLFNGYQTIVKSEIANGAISEDKGNLHYFDKINADNAIDVFEEFVQSANDKLVEQDGLNLLCSRKAMQYYNIAYRDRFGSLPYNTKFEKPTLDIAPNIKLVDLPNVPIDFMQLSSKKNVQMGICTNTPDCKFEVNKSLKSHFWLDFVGTMFFGVQYESISPEFLHIGMQKTTASNPPQGGDTQEGA